MSEETMTKNDSAIYLGMVILTGITAFMVGLYAIAAKSWVAITIMGALTAILIYCSKKV